MGWRYDGRTGMRELRRAQALPGRPGSLRLLESFS